MRKIVRVLAVNPLARAPHKVHVFHALLGKIVSARTVCGRIRPEGAVWTAVPATHRALSRYDERLEGPVHPDGDTVCIWCWKSVDWELSSDNDFLDKAAQFKRLKW